MIYQSEDDVLSSLNAAAWATICLSPQPDAATVNRVLSLVLEDHVIIEVLPQFWRRWKLRLTVLEHVHYSAEAKAVWQREFGPFKSKAQAYQGAELFIENCHKRRLVDRLVRGTN